MLPGSVNFKTRGSMTQVFLAFAILLLSTLSTFACGPKTDCKVGDRTYRLYVPEGKRPMGVFLFAHGYGGSGEGTMKNPALRELADEIGMALVALDSAGPEWNVPHTPDHPDQSENLELDYVKAVLEDLPLQFDLDPARIVATGFSSGGMFTWTIACELSERFAGFVPMSGTFWTPVPTTCPAPPRSLVHIHGSEDRVVPFEGSVIGEARQGNLAEALATYRVHGNFEPTGTTTPAGDMVCETAASPEGLVLDFCTFKGGHSFSVERLRYGIERVLG
jgi:polyhydroxybutyrate depolymerase